MEEQGKLMKKKTITAVLLACFVLVSCNSALNADYADNIIQVQDNSNFDSIITIAAENLNNVFYGGELQETYRSLGDANVGAGVYAVFFNNRSAGEVTIYLYCIERGIVKERLIYNVNVLSMTYGEKHQKLILYRDAERFGGSENPDTVIALNMDMEEQWRLQIPNRIVAVEAVGDFYYVVSTNKNSFDSSSPESVTIIDVIDSSGRIINTHNRENFEFLTLTTYEDFHIVSGIQIVGDSTEAIAIYGNRESLFSDRYVVIENQGRVEYGVIANETLMLTVRTGLNAYLTIIDINDMSIVKVLDISETTTRYELIPRGFFYGEDRSQIAVIGRAVPHSRLSDERMSLLLIPITSEFEVNSVFTIDIGVFDFSIIRDISESEDYMHIVSNSWDFSVLGPDNLIEFDIRKDLFTQ